MDTIQTQLQKAAVATATQLGGEVLTARAAKAASGADAVDIGTATNNPYALEIIGITVLEAALYEATAHAGECPCPTCVGRVERLTAALAVLKAAHDPGTLRVTTEQPRH